MKKSELQQIIREEISKILNNDSLNVGDKFKVVKSPDSKFMQYLKSTISIFYDRKLQPQLGDIFKILPNESKELDNSGYTIENINRPEEFIKALDPNNTKALIFVPKKWADDLYSKGYFVKID